MIHDLVNQGSSQTIKIEDWDVQKNTLIHTTLTSNGKKEKTVLQFIGQNKEIEYEFWFREGERKLKVYSEQQYNLLKHMAPPKVIDYSKRIMSQMPGKVISVNVKPGQEVQDGQEICVIEAMKMQNLIKSERVGTLKTVNIKPGETIDLNHTLVEFS